MFTTAYCALKQNVVSDFLRKATIDIKDCTISKLSKLDIAENHFHLNGSTQVFPISFACVMNNIGNQQKQFKKLTKYFHGRLNYDTEGSIEKSLYEKCIIAAAIRLYLFTKLNGNDTFLTSFHINENDIYELNATNIPDIDRANICASINTDDIGVFDTSLQNEFALLSTAMKKRGNGQDEIFSYLNQIRKFGVQQRFD